MRQSAAAITVEAIEIITPAGRRRGIATVTLAFVADPVVRWAWPGQDSYLTYWPRIVEAFGGRAFEHGARRTESATVCRDRR